MEPLLLAYLAFTFVLAATPGATTAVVVRSTIAGGRVAGFSAAAGAAVANSSQAAAAGLGMAVLLARFPGVLALLRVAGAMYLAWLGLSSLWRLARPREAATGEFARDAIEQATLHRASFRQGLTVNLLNPAISTFYLVVVPSFVPLSAPPWYYAMLAAMHVAIAFTCHGVWAMAFDRLRNWLRGPAAHRALDGLTGAALLGLAARVLSQS